MRYVIIGNSAAGTFAVEGIRLADRAGEIVVLGNEARAAYSRCLVTHYIEGRVSEKDMALRGEDFPDRMDARICYGCRVRSVDVEKRLVYYNEDMSLAYDRLLIATGASPKVPEIQGIQGPGVYTLRTLDDARRINVEIAKGERAVVLGAGPVGLKVAHALRQRGMQVSVVAGSPHILSRILDRQGAEIIQDVLTQHGMEFHLGSEVREVARDPAGRVSGVVLADGGELECRMVVVGKGVQPNVAFLKDTPIAVNRGVVVNEHLETNVPGVFAAGDVAETYDLACDEARINATWPNAAEQGRLAGENMAGRRVKYAGSIGMNAIGFYGVPAITAGRVRVPGPGFEILERLDRPRRTYRRLVFRDSRLVGFAMVGEVDGAGVLTGLIKQKVTIRDKERLLEGMLLPPVKLVKA
ncbi:MAG: FAD-dependent oxidoreductase [Bacillota bacterium]